MSKNNIAVIFTCFNRKEKTVRCLRSLQKQNNMLFDLYVCDDASTDGTVEAIRHIYPDVHIINGTGNLFWTKGMYKAMKAAIKGEYDYYLMVNDDVEFKDDMWTNMYEPFVNGNRAVGVVGYMTIGPNSKNITYGGRVMKRTRWNYCVGDVVPIDNKEYASCDVANWNCFLIDKYVVEKIGLLDPYYAHALGDFDYCLRMRKAKLKIFVAKQTVGYCSTNSRTNTYLDSNLSRKKRFELINKPNGFPAKSWIHFCNKHCGIYKFRCGLVPLIKDYLTILLGKDIR